MPLVPPDTTHVSGPAHGVTLENVATLLAAVIIIHQLIKVSTAFYKSRRAFSWHDVETWVQDLYTQLAASRIAPDVIVGLGRGGAVAAGMLSTKYRDDPVHQRRVIPIAAIDRIYVHDEPVIVGVHNLDLHNKRVLLLNADTYSGLTLYKARQILKYAEPRELNTASLVTFGTGDHQPDFSGARLPLRAGEKNLPWRLGTPRETAASVPTPTTIVVLNGLVATGKTSVADSLVKRLGFHPVYSDWYWFSYGLQDRAKDPSISQRHNEHMIALCLSAAAMGASVVLDTTSRWQATRDQIQADASKCGIRVIFVRCQCSEDASRSRIRDRKYIGPHDFGTDFEYDRIKKEYQEFDTDELSALNIVNIDTERLDCKMTNWLGASDKLVMISIVEAVREHYFKQVRDAPRSAPEGGH